MWPRATLFAKLCSIIGRSALPGTFKNTSLDEYDVFTQHYFLWMFRVLTSSPDNIKDFSDGTSYCTKGFTMSILSTLLYYMSQQEIGRVEGRILKEIKTINKPNHKQFDGIDSDLLLSSLLSDFLSHRSAHIKTLRHKYFHLYEIERGHISLDQFRALVVDNRPSDVSIEYYVHPRKSYIDRAYLYALTTADNGLTLAVNDFVAACHRFGLDCPFPYVLRRERLGGDELGALTTLEQGQERGQHLRQPSQEKKDDDKAVGKAILGGLSFSAGAFARMLERKKREQDNNKKGTNQGAEEAKSGLHIDSASTLFAQHYSIIRELLGYCTKFKEELASRNDLEEVWKNLDLLMSILEAGCHFLKFPIIASTESPK